MLVVKVGCVVMTRSTFLLKMARERTFSHFFFEKKCVFVPKSLIWLLREGRDVLGSSVYFSSVLTKHLGNLEYLFI